MLRVRHPGTTPRDRDLGPAHAERTRAKQMRMSLDEAIEYAARWGHEIKGIR